MIAFHFDEASTLPEVDDLTFADRVYASSYVLITVALVQSVFTNTLARRGQHDRAVRIDRVARLAFPAATIVLTAVSYALTGR